LEPAKPGGLCVSTVLAAAVAAAVVAAAVAVTAHAEAIAAAAAAAAQQDKDDDDPRATVVTHLRTPPFGRLGRPPDVLHSHTIPGPEIGDGSPQTFLKR